MVNHSINLKLFFKNISFLLAAVLLTLAVPHLSKAQMFSVGGEGPRFDTPNTGLYLGVEPIDVNYEGSTPLSSGGGLFDFTGTLIRLGYDSRTLDLSLGTGGEVTGIDDVSYFDIEGRIKTGIRIHRSKTVSLQFPIHIASRYLNMANSQAFQLNFNRFRFGSLTVGGGLNLLLRPKDNIRIEGAAVPSYGFAFATGGSYNGSLGSVKTRARLYLDRLFGEIGLSFGYSYDLRNYNIERNIYDYRISGHVIEAGVTF